MSCLWIDCKNAEVVRKLPFTPTRDGVDGWGVLVCSPASLAMRNVSCESLFGLIGPMQWHTVREPHLGLTLEERDLDLAIGTMLLTCALSMLEISGIEGGDIALVNGDGAFAAALMCVAHMQGAKCVQTLSASQPPRTGANCFLDLNNASWRRTLLDTDQKMRGRIVFFDLTGDPQEIASILPNLGKLGKLVLCRQDKPTKLLFNAYRDIHRTSVEVRSWKLMPGTSSFDTLPQAYRRAQQLIKWRKDVLSHLLTNLTQYFPMYSNSP